MLFRRTHMLRMLSLVLVVTLALSLLPPSVAVVAAQGGNLLQNPGFEQPYIAVDGDSTLRVAAGWQPWSVEGSGSTAINARPEYQPAPASRVRSGVAAQEYNTFFATHTGGVYQRVPVAAGTTLQFSVYVYVWSSASFDNPDVSDDPNEVKVRVGIDPTGGTDGTSTDIVWSTDQEFYDEYRQLSVTATASSAAVTVFVRSAPEDFVGTTNIYLDDALLVPTAIAPPTATPPGPTATPDFVVPTQEGTLSPVPPSATPTATPITPSVPTATPVPTLPPVATATPIPFMSPTPITPPGSNQIIYTVVAGDTVSQIARRFGSTIDAIVGANGLTDAGLIYVGQTLVIPVSQPPVAQPPTFTPNYVPAPTLTPVPPAPSLPGSPTFGTYTVQVGDTLSSIAARFNTTVATLAQLNNIVNANLIYPGQVLGVPGGVPIPAPPLPPAPTAAPPPPATITHVVQVGDNLYRISLLYGVSADAIIRANSIANPNLIFPGQVLVIPR